ncbi:enoyl-CoA hydratase/isomerase family protein [Rhodococcus sp. 15-649-1-2]|nr:enoyl-CoA hydratase/isomerase family protein [Rhodococcus sp. 15-649-1-2]OZE80183.1 enoyl-CoA hydratase/isomerase family protein [Rhodococcus sp. 15-649-1-2]
MSSTVSVVDLDRPGSLSEPSASVNRVVIGTSSNPRRLTDSARKISAATDVNLTEADSDDVHFVQVDAVDATVDSCRRRIALRPRASAVVLEVLRSFESHRDAEAGLLTESLAYSTLQAGQEFQEWLSTQKARRTHMSDDCVRLVRRGDGLEITFDRPDMHNAFSDALRAGLLAGLDVAVADSTITAVTISGCGPSFCSGGDLREFGLFDDPASSHVARRSHSPATLLEALRHRLGKSLHAVVHGAVIGSGLEMAAFCGTVTAHPNSIFGLPELTLGLIPGAGGTVSVTRRTGRWRTAYLVLSGAQIDASTALRWGLIDSIAEQ